ncbi:MAG: Asp23/Gls24 family envelope stress response protein [Anaerolineales bacterium]|nr:Asp23/Gls24 family envelope stress response protein [Anaerolineales bacterium]
MRNADSTTVAPDVLQSIARLTALQVPGVYALVAHGVGRRSDQGVRVKIDGLLVEMDLYLVLDKDVNLRQVSREVQAAVTRAIAEMVGMRPGRINIHIEDIHYPETS